MGKWNKLLDKILQGSSDASIPFDDLCGLLERLRFEKRTRGSHNVFRRIGVAVKPNLQRDGQHAKPYQVKQVRDIIIAHNLGRDI